MNQTKGNKTPRSIAINTIVAKLDLLMRDVRRLREQATYKHSRAEGMLMAADVFEAAAKTMIERLEVMNVRVTIQSTSYHDVPQANSAAH